MIDDSTNLSQPWFGPGLPVYPQVNSFCRVFGPRISASNVYNAFASQVSFPTLNLRDREQVWVREPNGIALPPGYYDCRLMGSFLSRPLYFTNCCPLTTSSGSPSTLCPTLTGNESAGGGIGVSLSLTANLGDLLIAFITWDNSVGTIAPTPPSWTLLDTLGGFASYYKFSLGGLEGFTYITNGDTVGNLVGISGSIGIDAEATAGGFGPGCVAPSVVTTGPFRLLLAAWSSTGIAFLSADPSMTDLGFIAIPGPVGIGLDVGYQCLMTTGPTGNKTATGGTAGAATIGQLVAVA